MNDQNPQDPQVTVQGGGVTTTVTPNPVVGGTEPAMPGMSTPSTGMSTPPAAPVMPDPGVTAPQANDAPIMPEPAAPMSGEPVVTPTTPVVTETVVEKTDTPLGGN